MKCKMSKNGVEFEFDGSADEIGTVLTAVSGVAVRQPVVAPQRRVGRPVVRTVFPQPVVSPVPVSKVKSLSRKFKHWTDGEDGLLHQMNADGQSIAEIARALGRTRRGIKARMRRLFAGKAAPNEDEVTRRRREAGRKGGKIRAQNERLRKALANKSQQPVQQPVSQPTPNVRWSSTEDEYLRHWVGKLSVAQIAAQLNRPLSSVYQSIHRIGLGNRIKLVNSMGPIPEGEQNAAI